MKYADLHVHTFYSDSTFSPEEVVAYAHEKALEAVAICDHDSIEGIAPCQEAARPVGIEIIPGIEMTAEKLDAEIHILGYYIDWQKPWFQKKLKEIQAARVERVHTMVAKLREAGIEISASDVFSLAGRGTVGRLHVAKAILKAGKVKSYKKIFDKYLGFRKKCYVSYTKFTPKDAIETLLKAGGVPVLAHPNLMGKDEYISEFAAYGLRGIEVYHTDHDHAARGRYEALAKEYGLLMTGGSDCHGLGKGKVLMGGVRVPYDLVEKLKEESERIRSGSWYIR